MSDKLKPLNPQQERFCQEFLVDLNATHAAIRAEYGEKGASQQGWRMMEDERIQRRIQELMDERSQKTGITAALVLSRLLEIADSDLAKAYDENNQLLPIKEIPQDVRRAISGVKVFEEFEGTGRDRIKVGETRELKFWDKNKALENLGRHLKLFTDKLEVKDATGLAERIGKARKRATK